MSASTARAGAEVHFRAVGVEQVKRATMDISRSTDQMKQRFGASAQQMAGALEHVARQGKMTGESIARLTRHGGQMAMMFGPHGAIAGAVLMLGTAMVSFWQRQRREMEETRKKAEEEMGRLVNAGDYKGLNKALRATEIGTAANRYEDGIVGRERKIGDLNAQIAAVKTRKERDDIYRQIAEERRALIPLIAERERLRAMILDPRTGQLSSFSGMAAVTTTANAPGFKGKAGPGAKPMGAKNELRGMIEASGAQRRQVEGTWLSQSVDNMMPKVTTAGLNIDIAGIEKALREQLKGLSHGLAEIAEVQFGEILGEGVANGFQRAFSGEGISGIMKGFAQTVLSSIGGIFQQMGAAYLSFGKIMKAFAAMLPNPFTAGAAGVAIGFALMALGGALQGVAGGMGSGGGGGGGGFRGGAGSSVSSSIVDRGLINPLNPLTSSTAGRMTAQQPIVNNFTVVGANDPRAQREIAELVKNGRSRGLRYG